MNKFLTFTLFLIGFYNCNSQNQSASNDKLLPFENDIKEGQTVQDRMIFHKVPAVSIAIFKEDSVIYQKAFGVKEIGRTNKADVNTKFQAASISKAVTALGIIKLVEEYNLDLDRDVNHYLNNWNIDSSENPNQEKVTIKRLLNHTAGINVSGFQGYSKDAKKIPSTLEILNGKGNSDKIKLDTIPGSKFSYSGGGYTVLQKLIEDVSGRKFAEYFEEQIFIPLRMSNSSFKQFPKENVSFAHSKEGDLYKNQWKVFPELAAAGLWTTPSDLAKFCIAIQKAYRGEPNSIISESSAYKLLTPVVDWSAGKYGLGIAIRGENENEFFWHAGANPGGYRSIFLDFFHRNMGIIVMTNSESGASLYNEIIEAFFKRQEINL